ncbi:MAG: helix-turn-helix domain-containing protein [Candidatus Acidoferrales bacterium]
MLATTLPRLLTPDDAAAAIGVCTATLSIWRCTKRYDLPYVRCGRLIRYKEKDVADFIERRRVTPNPRRDRR